jgi:glycosyltransferase involved in cell wall biosynthesis
MQPPEKFTMPDEPLVSICIPTYNRAGMIGRAIESALGQTYKNIEVIVVDNASSDNTAAVVASYEDESLTYVKNERNLGLFGNFNRCIELATGKYLHILHSDDYIDPNFTALCIAFFQENPSVVMTSTRARIVSDGFEKNITCSDTDRVYTAPEGFRRLLASRSFIACSSVMVKREIYDETGPFNPEYPYSSDFFQWLKIARNHDIGFVSGACVFYLQGEHSETFRLMFSSPQGYLDMLRIFIQLQIDLGKDLDQYAAECLAAQRRFIHDCLFAGFTRGDTMPGFSASVFNGFSLTCWTLEKPLSVTQSFGKLQDLVVILSAGLLMSWSPSRRIIRALFFSHREGY